MNYRPVDLNSRALPDHQASALCIGVALRCLVLHLVSDVFHGARRVARGRFRISQVGSIHGHGLHFFSLAVSLDTHTMRSFQARTIIILSANFLITSPVLLLIAFSFDKKGESGLSSRAARWHTQQTEEK